jgi:hypothetical protein
MVMSPEEIYWEEQEYNRAQEIMQKKHNGCYKRGIRILKENEHDIAFNIYNI